MSLDDWATEHGYTLAVTGLPAWLDRHPDVAAEITAARNRANPWPYQVIADWLRDAHGYDTTDTTIRKWVSRHGS